MTQYWFKPKKFGYGATPATWQGWVLGVVYVVVVVAASVKLVPWGGDPTAGGVAAWIVIVTAATAAAIVIAYRKTDGPWRWHWGPRRGSVR